MKRDSKNIFIPLNIGFIYILIIIILSYCCMTASQYWQFIPIVIFSIIFLIDRTFINTSRKIKKLPQRYWISGFILVLAGTTLLNVLLPFAKLPEPTGFNSIGTKYFTLTNHSDINGFAVDAPQQIQIHAQLWYPAIVMPGDKPEDYIPQSRKYSRIFSKANNISWIPFILNHLKRAKSNSYLNAEINDNLNKYPLIIFSHGHRQFYKHNTSIIEELASNGYIVLAITHLYFSSCAVNSDNKLVFNASPGITSVPESPTRSSDIQSVLRSIETSEDINELRKLYKIAYEHLPPDRLIQDKVWLGDMLFSLSKLEEINSLYLNNFADLGAIGVMGFSFGGGTAGLAAMSDEKIKAGVNLDGWQPGHTRENYFNCPFMFIMSEDHKGANDFFLEYSQNMVIDLTIDGTKHTNFSDMAIISGICGKLSGYTGKINSKYGLRITKELTVNFFNQYLKGDDPGILYETLNKYPDIYYKINNM